GDRQEVAFEAEVPGQVKITKTFSLAKGDYHVGLTIRLESLQKGENKFRYQLAGAQGLPIEGEWYTYTLRNSMIGTVDKKGNTYRELEDSRQIAHKWGGERVIRGDNRIQYGGVGVQYFASMIVVDDQQPKTDFLEWARPTLELATMR